MTWTEEQANSIILPQAEFRGATLEEAVDFLRRESITRDPAKKGVNMIIKHGRGQPVDLGDLPGIKLSLKKISLKTALEAVAEQAGAKLYFDPLAVIFQFGVEEK